MMSYLFLMCVMYSGKRVKEKDVTKSKEEDKIISSI